MLVDRMAEKQNDYEHDSKWFPTVNVTRGSGSGDLPGWSEAPSRDGW
jgi:hypothetical protein